MKRLVLTPDELAIMYTNNELDDAGNVILSPEASKILIEAVQNALRRKDGKPRKKPVNLSDPDTLLKYKNRMTVYMVAHPGAGIKEISKAIKLGESTVSKNPDLHEWYDKLLSGVSLAAPATVSNDDDYNYGSKD